MSERYRVLIAEDDPGIRNIIRTRLRAQGYDTEAVRTGLEALSRIASWRPDALVLDINMPELDGFGVLETLKQEGRPIPRTLMLTARHSRDDVQRALELGAKDFLGKPFSEVQLMARVARLLRICAPTAEVVSVG